jgi:hypothetical protein
MAKPKFQTHTGGQYLAEQPGRVEEGEERSRKEKKKIEKRRKSEDEAPSAPPTAKVQLQQHTVCPMNAHD